MYWYILVEQFYIGISFCSSLLEAWWFSDQLKKDYKAFLLNLTFYVRFLFINSATLANLFLPCRPQKIIVGIFMWIFIILPKLVIFSINKGVPRTLQVKDKEQIHRSSYLRLCYRVKSGEGSIYFHFCYQRMLVNTSF